MTAEPAAAEWLAQRLGEDRMLLRRELEKLALFVGAGGKVTPEAAVACVAEGSALDLEEALMAAMAGEMAVADKALDTAFAEGANAVQVVRAALRHVQRLHLAALAVAAAPRPPAARGLAAPAGVLPAQARDGTGAARLAPRNARGRRRRAAGSRTPHQDHRPVRPSVIARPGPPLPRGAESTG